MKAYCDPAPVPDGTDRPCSLASLSNWSGATLAPAILDTIDALIVVLDARGHILTFNRGCERATGFRCEEVRGRAMWDVLIPDEERERVRGTFATIRDLRQPVRQENHWLTKPGGRRLIAWSNTFIADEAGKARYIIGTGTDVTEQRNVEAALRDSEARLQAIVRTAADGIIIMDERGNIESANAAAERMFGYASGELAGTHVKLLMPEPYRREHDQYVADYLNTGKARVIGIGREVTGLRRDGSTFPVALAVSEVRLGERRLFTGILHDITSRKRLEREILEISGNEQRRIGQDLHDGLCQHLTGIAFACQAMINELADAEPKRAGRLEKIRTMVDEAIGQARRLARGLQPVFVGQHGLPSALKELSRHAQELFDVSCRFTCDHDVPDVDQPAATHLYRIAQEAITNAVRHGRAERILVRLSASQGQLRLSVRENGVGMATVPGEGRGMGLHIMRYRAGVIGASLTIESRPGAGTTVTCTLPTNSRSSHEIDYSL